MKHTLLPYHRIPADIRTPPVLVVGHHVLCRAQTVEEVEETAAYLDGWLTLVQTARWVQIRHAKGALN
jgi:hypothetical protein